MSNADNAILYYEAGQDPTGFTALTDSGDAKTFNSAVTMFSNVSGKEPDVKPNGLASGGAVTVGVSGSDNKIDVAALTCYLAGVLTSVSAAADETITRATSTDTHIINSVTVTSAGAIAIVAGTDGTSFSETRGAAGGPPWIDNDAIEIAQVRTSSYTAAAVLASEIKQVPGTHQERYNYPTWTIDYARVEDGQLGYAGVNFTSALDLIHSEDAGTTTAAKLVYVEYNEPTFAEVPDASEFVPPANSHSVNSKQVYGRTIGSSSSSLNQGSFNAELDDGVSDGFLASVDDTLWFKFKPDRLKTPYILAQGKLGVTSSFPAGDSISASCTISAGAVAERITA